MTFVKSSSLRDEPYDRIDHAVMVPHLAARSPQVDRRKSLCLKAKIGLPAFQAPLGALQLKRIRGARAMLPTPWDRVQKIGVERVKLPCDSVRRET